jgi:DNA-binding transcriptional ArsR family regulator
VARNGREYRRAWEQRLDPSRRPELPAAVRTYDSTGETRTVSFDLDCKKAGARAAVLRDFERLAGWLDEAGCSWLADESSSGGRHVYVLLDHNRTMTELSPVLRELRASGALPTLDPSPMCNLTEGCIRPPGSTHRLGGYQRLLTSLSRAYRTVASPTTASAWRAFLSLLPAMGRVEVDLRAPARDGVTTGPARPLAPAYDAIARTGRHDTARYPSPSEARAAVLLHALCRGWTSAEIAREVKTGAWSGLRSLYEQHYGRHYADRAIAADVGRALAHHDELPFRGFHTSAKRPRAGGGKAARLQLLRWTAAVRLALSDGRWDSSLATEQLLVALGDASRRSQSIYIAFGCRHLSMGAGTTMDHSTAARLLKRLASEDDPFVLLIESDRGIDADVYELRIPDAYLDRLPSDDALPAPPRGVHPAFALLERPIYRLYTVLERLDRPVGPSVLASEARVALSTVYKHLPAMAQAGLVARHRDGTVTARAAKALTRFARKYGVAARLAATVTRWRTERNSLRIAHGLPELAHPPGTPRVAWPGQPPRSVGAPSPTASAASNATPPPDALRAAQERAIGGGQPDWRTDLEQAALSLLQREFDPLARYQERRSTST